MACSQANCKHGLRPVRCFFTILLLITICSHAKPCTCSSHDRRRSASYTWTTTFKQMDQGLLFRRDNGSAILQPGSLGYYMVNRSDSGFKSADSGWFVIPKWFDPWKTSHGNDGRVDLHEAISFSIFFTTRAVSTTDPLLFDILPRLEAPDDGGVASTPPAAGAPQEGPPTNHRWDTLSITPLQSGRTRSIRVTATFGSTETIYSVRVDYDRVVRTLTVYLVSSDAGTTVVPAEPISQILDAGDALSPDALLFAISSSMEQLVNLQTWNITIEVPVTEQSQGPNTATIVSSVLGSAAATAAIAAAVYLYLNSKYRRWKKDLDQLAMTMHSLPGVPTQVDFADIKKATNNFHEATRMGQGGFGAVYRCKLPAPRKGGDLMDVAIKKFTRADNKGYEDFLAEVSIINRLRHKNIVPLVGWSYNRGEHILVYEYMPNGSLDQHLFHRKGDDEQQQQLPTSINQWSTRYNIVKGIATGLQYVHHEYEPMVLHRDIKASNILIDFTFQGRLGDFGLACVLADGKSSYSDQGAPGTVGFRAPEYVYNGRATRKTDIFAFGVLVLEIVTGRRAVGRDVQFGHITDWVWRLHAEGNLLAAVDAVLTTTTSELDADEATRLLLLGMACSSPNPYDRPSMVDALQIISKSVPPPDIPLSKPPLVWPPEGRESSSSTSGYSTSTTSNFDTAVTLIVETAGGEHICSENERGRRRFTSSISQRKMVTGDRLRLSL